MDSEIKKIGLFGGTFAPPHKGHIHAVKTMLEHINLDKILIMPTFIPPHKVNNEYDTPQQRYNMCVAAFGSIPKVEISDYEISKGGISYTVNTLRYLKNDSNVIYLMCGSDMFLTLDKWYHSDEIFQKAKIVCVPRYSDDIKLLNDKKKFYEDTRLADIYLIGEDPYVISSTEIRERIADRNDLTPYLTKEVIEIIKSKNLYLSDKIK